MDAVCIYIFDYLRFSLFIVAVTSQKWEYQSLPTLFIFLVLFCSEEDNGIIFEGGPFSCSKPTNGKENGSLLSLPAK